MARRHRGKAHRRLARHAIFAADPSGFDAYVASLEPRPVPAGRVPNSVFFLLDEKSGRLLGAVDIRHELNDWLLAHGGHIGDGIRPSERGHGLGTRLVALALDECRSLGIERVLMVSAPIATPRPRPSRQTAALTKGRVTSDDGTVQRRFWIDLMPGRRATPRTRREARSAREVRYFLALLFAVTALIGTRTRITETAAAICGVTSKSRPVWFLIRSSMPNPFSAPSSRTQASPSPITLAERAVAAGHVAILLFSIL